MYKRIVVATGGSPWSEAAVTYAIALASSLRAELRILTVLSGPMGYTMPDVMSSSELLVESVERQGKELLEHAAAQARAAGLAPISILKWGNIPEGILQTTIEDDCDLILLGSRQVTGWKRLMIGRTLNAVAAKTTRPVLVVKHAPTLSTDAIPWRRILVATGGSPWSDVAVDHALALARSQELEVCILCVDSSRSRPPADAPPLASKGVDILAVAEARALAAGVRYETHLGYGNVVEAIFNTATARKCDAIVLGSRGLTGVKRLMIGSISNAVTAKILLPVLIVKRFLL